MQALHSHPNKPKGAADFIKNIVQNDIPFSKGLYLAETVWEDPKMASVYLHRLEGLIQADTALNSQRDTYAIIIDGPVMYAYNVGGFPQPDFYLFDFSYYQTIEEKSERFRFLSYACLGGENIPENTLVLLYDQHKKIMLEEFYSETTSQ
ncbi:hypothetical protein WJR50_25575 [Catalinimonas sp. 4WD22]|uniref:hypothetical protein n=1 Tax=Catalinimonas locisalis TaxID=3133978 RepID=UPI003100F83B